MAQHEIRLATRGVLPPRGEVIRLLSIWRFPGDPSRQAVFREHPPDPLELVAGEFGLLAVYERQRRRLDDIERAAAAHKSRLVPEIRDRIAAHRRQLVVGSVPIDLGPLERLCNRANLEVLLASTKRGSLMKGRRRGAFDPLSRAIAEIIVEDPRASQKTVKAGLLGRADLVIDGNYRIPKSGALGLRWRHGSKAKTTTWRQILNGRLPRVRAFVDGSKAKNGRI